MKNCKHPRKSLKLIPREIASGTGLLSSTSAFIFFQWQQRIHEFFTIVHRFNTVSSILSLDSPDGFVTNHLLSHSCAERLSSHSLFLSFLASVASMATSKIMIAYNSKPNLMETLWRYGKIWEDFERPSDLWFDLSPLCFARWVWSGGLFYLGHGMVDQAAFCFVIYIVWFPKCAIMFWGKPFESFVCFIIFLSIAVSYVFQ